jgi:integrase/recombinase XerC
VPSGEDAGEFHASLARHKRYYLMAVGQSAKTVADRLYTMRRLERWLRRELRIDPLQATEDDLLDWAMEGLAHLKASSRAAEIKRIRVFYAWRLDHDGAESNPAARVPIPQAAQSQPDPIDDDALTKAFRIASTLPDWRISIALILAALGGLRIGEIARLHRRDFRVQPDGRVVINVIGKGRGGGKARPAVLSPAVWGLLLDCGLPEHGPIIPRRDGKPGPLPAGPASWLLNSFLHQVVGTRYTIHSLRDWFGTELYDETRDLRLVQDLLGHQSPTTTAGYVKIVEARNNDQVDALDTRLPDLGLAPVHDLDARRRRKAEGGSGGGPRRDPQHTAGSRARIATPVPSLNDEPMTRSCRDRQQPRRGQTPGCP